MRISFDAFVLGLSVIVLALLIAGVLGFGPFGG